MEMYNYEWTDIESIIKNKNTVIEFRDYGITSLAKLAEAEDDEVFKQAHKLWLKLKDAFNDEAKNYEPKARGNFSRLGSMGLIEEREVKRRCWWQFLDGDSYGSYVKLTKIIEALHSGEQLESGKIYFSR